MKLVRVTGRWSSVINQDADVVLNADAIVRVDDVSRTAYVGLELADGHYLNVSHAELRRILRAAGETMPPRRDRPKKQ